MGLRDDILNSHDLPTEKVHIPEWNLDVWVRSMTGLERDLYEADLLEDKDKSIKEKLRNMRAKLAVLCTVDENGERVFDESDVEELGKKSAKALDRIFNAIQILNALGDEAIEDIAKN